ncbi:MAG: KUP/HAK/KT family potassium transporter, partial [Fimbriimonadaceae bacterium]|nr:KUP/HAK/KT family potassium transporter [Chitinophagales bacterium]
MSSSNNYLSKFSIGGLLITLGIIYGDIGTSPIYVMRAIVGEHTITEDLVLGAVSCVFWTLILITTIKYVILALNNDNHGEGGIFALYALLRRYKIKWAIVPALIGCAALIADGFITPSISISSAVEGLNSIDSLNVEINTVPIVVIILIALFTFQQFGTKVIGSLFGPVMIVWFIMIGFWGFLSILENPIVLKALNPKYAIDLLTKYEKGFWLLGGVFLCTTGAEALYSDLGHCGKKNVRIGWIFISIMLMINYLGQASFLLDHEGSTLQTGESPFYSIMPEWFLPAGVIIATMATIIASQALITGSFTLVNEAMKLKLWTNLKVIYPSNIKGQIYIPAINWFLLAGCLTVVFLFRESANMENAYGLSIIFNMLMTTVLLTMLMLVRRINLLYVISFVVIYLFIEGLFLIANLSKFSHGGWFTVMLASVLFFVLWLYYAGTKL